VSLLAITARALAFGLACLLGACRTAPPNAHASADDAAERRGTLLLIGGGLDNDNRPIYSRFLTLASRAGTPHVAIVTVATGDQEQEAIDKREALLVYAPALEIDVLRRETPTEETVAVIERATALLFTGGDQQRIADRYRPGGEDTPELRAMRELLHRGGVIAGCSAGDAMMGEIMFLSGSSAHALGVDPEPASTPVDGARSEPILGPRLGPGLGFLPGVITDSHFFERDRLGRLVAALEETGVPIGIGVGEDAAVEIDLATLVLRSVGVSDSLLVDARALRRDGLSRRGARAWLLREDERFSLRPHLARPLSDAPAQPAGAPYAVPIVEPGQNRQLASWRLFARASDPRAGALRLALPGWAIVAWSDGRGGSVCDLLVRAELSTSGSSSWRRAASLTRDALVAAR
jgi:cyanophycinase